jgi:hypothetical protein
MRKGDNKLRMKCACGGSLTISVQQVRRGEIPIECGNCARARHIATTRANAEANAPKCRCTFIVAYKGKTPLYSTDPTCPHHGTSERYEPNWSQQGQSVTRNGVSINAKSKFAGNRMEA